jgi:hypothetical protein
VGSLAKHLSTRGFGSLTASVLSGVVLAGVAEERPALPVVGVPSSLLQFMSQCRGEELLGEHNAEQI